MSCELSESADAFLTGRMTAEEFSDRLVAALPKACASDDAKDVMLVSRLYIMMDDYHEGRLGLMSLRCAMKSLLSVMATRE